MDTSRPSRSTVRVMFRVRTSGPALGSTQTAEPPPASRTVVSGSKNSSNISPPAFGCCTRIILLVQARSDLFRLVRTYSGGAHAAFFVALGRHCLKSPPMQPRRSDDARDLRTVEWRRQHIVSAEVESF